MSEVPFTGSDRRLGAPHHGFGRAEHTHLQLSSLYLLSLLSRMCLLQSMAWRSRPLCPARTWWWTAPPTPRFPTRRGSSAASCLRWGNSSNPGSGGRRRPATSSRTSPEVGLAAGKRCLAACLRWKSRADKHLLSSSS